MATLGGDLDQWYLMASDAGYGFRVQLNELITKNKAGKALLSLPQGACVIKPVPVSDSATDRLVAITNEGRMLVFPVSELPALARGKGNKIISIPSKRVVAREEFVVAVACVPEGGRLVVYSGKRHISLKSGDLDQYQGERGRRGNKLPRGFQKVDTVDVEVSS